MFCEKTVLDNGVCVLTEHMESVRSVALGMWVRVGNRDETPEQAGISHFMEHMLFKGTPTRSALDISMHFDSIGAELNAFTSREYTCFYARFMDTHLATAFEVLSDMVVNAKFAQEDIDPERQVVIEEIARSEDAPDEYVFDVFSDAIYPTHPLGRPVLGNRGTVSGFTTDDMRAYHDAHYTTENLTIVACGNIAHDDVVELAKRYLEDMIAGERLVRRDAPEASRMALNALTKDTEQAHVILGYPSICARDERRFAYSLLETILGGAMSARLFQEIREKRGLAYAVFTSTALYEDAGSFSMYAGSRPENLEEVITVAREQFEKVRKEGVTQAELERAQELASGSFVMGMESTRVRMTRLGRMATCNLELSSVEETLQKYRNVTVADVNAAAEELFGQDMITAVVSPYSQTEIEEMV